MSDRRLSHIAFMVNSAEKSAASLSGMGYMPGPIETWPGEGTKEIYFGKKDLAGRLLLMEPVADGAYRRAMAKRGPGLHHVGIDVTDLESYIDGLAGSGWYLHPKSLRTIQKTKTAWLARPGIPVLIEVQETDNLSTTQTSGCFISKLEIPLNKTKPHLLAVLGMPELIDSNDDRVWATIGQERFDASIVMRE